MTLDREQAMTVPTYSQLLSCLYDQAEPVGHLGRGTHHSIFRSVQWRDLDGDFRDSGRLHDFAVVWDEDHDIRVVSMVEHLHMAGLLWPVVFAGERKGTLTLLIRHGVDPCRERADWFDTVRDIAENAVARDPWTVEFGVWHRDPANRDGLTDPAGLIDDDDELVGAYLQAIDALWQLGEKRRAVHPTVRLAADAFEDLAQ